MSIALAATLVALAFGGAWWHADKLRGLVDPRLAIPLWCGLFVLEYAILGPRSFIYMDDEGDLAVTHLHFMSRVWEGGQYVHGLAGGIDATAGFVIGGEFLSFDRIFFSILPTWLAILANKVAIAGTGMTGTYLLCRYGLGTRTGIALAAGALFTVSHSRLVISTLTTAFSWAVIPMVVYAVIYRTGRKGYWLGIAAVSVLAAPVTIPTQGVLPLAATLLMASIFSQRWSWQALGGGLFVMAAISLNWVESLFGMLQLAPLSIAANRTGLDVPELGTVIAETVDLYVSTFFSPKFTGLGMAVPAFSWFFALITMSLLRDFRTWRGLVTLAIPFAAIIAFVKFPWELVGLAAVRGVTYQYFIIATVPFGITLAGYAAEGVAAWLETRSPLQMKFAARMTLAFPLGILGWYKIFALWQFLTVGGQGAYWTVENLREATSRPDDLNRVIVLRDKNLIIEPNIAFAFYGQEVFDGFTNFPFLAYRDYWLKGINTGGFAPAVFISPTYWDENSMSYQVDRQLDLTLLGAANVRFILSPVPLAGKEVRLIDGPESPPSGIGLEADNTYGNRPGALRRLEIAIDKAMAFKGRLFSYGKVYVYELPNVLSRAWAATGLVVVPDDRPEAEFLDLVKRNVLDRNLVVRETAARALGGGKVGPIRISGFREVKNGYDVDIEAPKGGIVVVNAQYQPFFSATADGRPVAVAPAAGVQTAIAVPAGTTRISLRYHRPTLLETVRHRLFRG